MAQGSVKLANQRGRGTLIGLSNNRGPLLVAEVRNIQIIVESHSEHLMRRLQRRVAEQEASSEDVKLYFVSSKGGRARISDLLLNEWGEIENWPEKFFGDEMGEIAAIAEASLRRKMEQFG